MGYVESNLMQGEIIVYRGRLHKILFLGSGMLALALLILGFWLLLQETYNPNFAYFCFLVTIIIMIPPFIQYKSSEFAITNKRVIVKVGFIRRHTLETLLQKIEAIRVDQSISGRILNYGTITIIGTGGTSESFKNIAYPLVFRRSVQEQSEAKHNTP